MQYGITDKTTTGILHGGSKVNSTELKQKDTFRVECQQRSVSAGYYAILDIRELAPKAFSFNTKQSYHTVMQIIQDANEIQLKASFTSSLIKWDLSFVNVNIDNIIVA